jgi:two-component system, OmpR family, sensor histidine kinase PhoQ
VRASANDPPAGGGGVHAGGWRRLRDLSLRGRILLTAAALLLVFVVLTGLTLERAFHDSALSAREARLLGQLYLLMAAADSEDGALRLPAVLDEPRLGLPGSGLYGQIADAGGAVVWRSPSTVGLTVPFLSRLGAGETVFIPRGDPGGRHYLVAGFGVLWSTGPVARAYTFSVAEDQAELRRELTRFRTSLFWGLGLTSLLLLIALLALLHWGLRPLRQVATELSAIEAGQRQRLLAQYPRDLRPLTDNLNALLAHGEARQARLGNALGDLAHSLKTPLAVIRGALAELEPGPDTHPDRGPTRAGPAQLIDEQVGCMLQIVDYQLERARAAAPGGGHALTAHSPVRPPIRPLVQRIAASLAKLHADKAVSLGLTIDPALRFPGVEGDLMEVLGNLLDNAYKWCRRQVQIGVDRHDGQLVISVADDGPGIPPGVADYLLERGVRADESMPGHGIGLSVVREIVGAYGGRVTIARSALGGALVQVRFPT